MDQTKLKANHLEMGMPRQSQAQVQKYFAGVLSLLGLSLRCQVLSECTQTLISPASQPVLLT